AAAPAAALRRRRARPRRPTSCTAAPPGRGTSRAGALNNATRLPDARSACDVNSADRCTGGQCKCGTNAPCGPNLQCVGGQCVCTPSSCPTGCCDTSTNPNGVCYAGGGTDPTKCGYNGATCASCGAGGQCGQAPNPLGT